MKNVRVKSNLDRAFTDLMVSLVVIFILLVVMLIVGYNTIQQKQRNRIDQLANNLRGELALKNKQLNLNGVQIKRDVEDPLSVDVIVPDSDLHFEFNQSTINASSQVSLQHLMPIIVSFLRKNEESNINFIRIEGFTDKRGGEGLYNLQLSQNRALAVLSYTIQQVFIESNQVISSNNNTGQICVDYNSENCKNKLFLIDKATISGYGSMSKYLLATDDQSRRVVIKIQVKPALVNSSQELLNK
jgi:outer membrane protein OmpA-like peptidoglycan-associated protein